MLPSIYSQMPSRREALRVGAGAFGLSLSGLLRAGAAQAKPAGHTPAARSVIVLYLSGGPSQLDMWDMKPQASEEIRGAFRAISTNVPGMQISEHMPRMARLADKYTIVRSMSHSESDHLRAGYWVMTGGRLTRPITAFSGMQRNDHPHMGAVAARWRPAANMPSFVSVPEFVSPRGVGRPGQHAGFLGPRFDPYVIQSDPNGADYHPGAIHGSGRASAERLASFRELVDRLERSSPIESTGPAREYEVFRQTALDLVSSTAARKAFDISGESTQTRDRYGRHIFGQSALVARRLVEAGVRLVQVNFIRHDNGPGGQGYDSHASGSNPPHLQWAKEALLPPTDAAFAALVEDLADRGLLDETLVVMMGEFGRTPKFNTGGGRDHWPGCYSLVLTGGGVAGGHVHGASDKIAARPVRDRVSPDDLLATIYQQLGIDHRALVYDLQDRPLKIVDGEPVRGLLAKA